MNIDALKEFLDKKVDEYNRPSFITDDPICIPHQFSRKQDIEIAGFFAASFAWGNRTLIIRKCRELLGRMDNAPYDFIVHHREKDLRQLEGFCHRTFNDTDLLYFVHFLHHHYRQYDSLEAAFSGKAAGAGRVRSADFRSAQASRGKALIPARAPGKKRPGFVEECPGNVFLPASGVEPIETALTAFHHYFFSLDDAPPRTRKHVASPHKLSGCKRLNMFLRWMVRKDRRGVDFGIWKNIRPAQLICPVDLHVARVTRRFGLINRPQADWPAAVQLTRRLREFDPRDPVKYDFALFVLGVIEKF